jgi:hypothetical protein
VHADRSPAAHAGRHVLGAAHSDSAWASRVIAINTTIQIRMRGPYYEAEVPGETSGERRDAEQHGNT